MASAILRIQQTFLPTIFGRNDVIKKRTLQVVLHRISTSSFSDFRNPSLRLTYRSTILRLIYRSKEEKFVTWRDFTNLLFSSVYSFEETASDRHSVQREDRYAGAGKARMGSYKGVKNLGSFLFILFEFVFCYFSASADEWKAAARSLICLQWVEQPGRGRYRTWYNLRQPWFYYYYVWRLERCIISFIDWKRG